MLIHALIVALLQQTPSVVWQDAAPPAAAEAPAATAPAVDIPDWARADPFAYERSRCSPLVRGDTPLETCQAETRARLAAAMGDDLPAALRPSGSPDDCQMMREAGGGSAYAVQCGDQRRDAAPSRPLQEQDCRPRPDGRGGFTSQCRPVVEGQEKEGLSLRLWGDKD